MQAYRRRQERAGPQPRESVRSVTACPALPGRPSRLAVGRSARAGQRWQMRNGASCSSCWCSVASPGAPPPLQVAGRTSCRGHRWTVDPALIIGVRGTSPRRRTGRGQHSPRHRAQAWSPARYDSVLAGAPRQQNRCGSGMGAALPWQAPPDAATRHRASHQQGTDVQERSGPWAMLRPSSVRIEGESSPLSSTPRFRR